MSAAPALFEPPRPAMLPALAALARTAWRGDGDLLSLLPAEAYRKPHTELGWSRRTIILFNDPALVREILHDKDGVFPKSDLMVSALEDLVGDSMFVSDGPKWRRQRAMIDPAFSGLRLETAFASMQGAVDDYERVLRGRAAAGEAFSLDLAMSHLTADVICRTVFSVTLASDVAKEVFEDFALFERKVAQVKVRRLIVDPAWTPVKQEPDVLAACARIREHLGTLLDTHLADGADFDDIASAVIAARDAETGAGFTREELIDQLGVFFLAGHETTASVLTWVFYVLATRADVLARIRDEVRDAAGDGEIGFETVKRLVFTKSVFKEALRLYPPLTFMPRVALKAATIGGRKLRKGALVMIAPWTTHRCAAYWENPHRFDAERFTPGREKDVTPGAYIPFGLGPHTCVGAGFAQIESVLIIARLARAFDFEIEDPRAVRPAARLTTRPAREISCRTRVHSG